MQRVSLVYVLAGFPRASVMLLLLAKGALALALAVASADAWVLARQAASRRQSQHSSRRNQIDLARCCRPISSLGAAAVIRVLLPAIARLVRRSQVHSRIRAGLWAAATNSIWPFDLAGATSARASFAAIGAIFLGRLVWPEKGGGQWKVALLSWPPAILFALITASSAGNSQAGIM